MQSRMQSSGNFFEFLRNLKNYFELPELKPFRDKIGYKTATLKKLPLACNKMVIRLNQAF